MTREEAIGALAVLWDNIYPFHPEEALKMAISALMEQPRWISVEDRLPEDDVDVLTRRATGMNVETHCGFRWDYDEYNGKWRVTHWMPLPEPPEVEV